MVERIYTALRAGDPEPALGSFAVNGRLRFPGDHSWTVDTTDAAQRRAWFERFAQQRPCLQARDVVVSGWPWRMVVCVIFDDALQDSHGRTVYANHGVQHLRLRWNKVVLDELALDTQLVAAHDAVMSDVR
jgi:ketosteroid isomerase-like protein